MSANKAKQNWNKMAVITNNNKSYREYREHYDNLDVEDVVSRFKGDGFGELQQEDTSNFIVDEWQRLEREEK